MQVRAYGALMVLGLSLAACGSDSLPGLRVTCERGGSVQPLERMQLRVQPATATSAATAVISFRDPLNRDQTSTLKVETGDTCTIEQAKKI